MPRLSNRAMGQEIRSWPMVALLLLVVIVAVGCLLWFLGEAMRNERNAMRAKLADAYRAHLSLAQSRLAARWAENLARLDVPEAPPARFAQIAREGLAGSALCFDESKEIVYPSETSNSGVGNDHLGALDRLRVLAKAGDSDALARYVLETFPSSNDAPGRSASRRRSRVKNNEIA